MAKKPPHRFEVTTRSRDLQADNLIADVVRFEAKIKPQA